MAETGVDEEIISQISQKAESSSRWNFLKKGLDKVRGKLNKNNALLEHSRQTPEAAKTPEVSSNKTDPQENETLEEKNAAKIGIDLRLYKDFINFLKDPKRVAGKEIAQKAEQALNTGDVEVIDTLARIMQHEYKNEVSARRTENINNFGVKRAGEFYLKNKVKTKGLTESERKTLEEMEFAKGELGVKLALVRSLIYKTSQQVQQEKGRRSVGEFMDIGLALSDKKDALMKDAGQTTAESAEKYIREHPSVISSKN